MSRLTEFKEMFHNIQMAWDRKQQISILTLIACKGAAYRLPGTKMMMSKDGHMHGTISGGCLESDLFGWAEKAMDVKSPLIQQYNLHENDIWGLGIGCKGILDVLILPIEQTDTFWNRANEIAQKDKPFTLILELPTGKQLLIETDGEMFGHVNEIPMTVIDEAFKRMHTQTRAEIVEDKGSKYYVDAVRSGEQLIIVGAGRDAMSVSKLAIQAGFQVTILDSRTEFNNPGLFPQATHEIKNSTDLHPHEVSNCWWVIMNHHKRKDEEALQLALRSNPCYIGVLGPMDRTEEMLMNIGKNFADGPIRSPIGLDLGSETMDEVAISIVAELLAIRNERNAVPLHGKRKIHA